MKSSTASSHGTLVVPRQLHVTGTTCFYILEVTTCIPCFRISQQQWHSCMPKIEAPRKGVTAYYSELRTSLPIGLRVLSGSAMAPFLQAWLMPFFASAWIPAGPRLSASNSNAPGGQRWWLRHGSLRPRQQCSCHLVAHLFRRPSDETANPEFPVSTMQNFSRYLPSAPPMACSIAH